MIARILASVILITLSTASGQPQVQFLQITNTFSLINYNLPNYGIAQGSIFTILGSNLARHTEAQTVPLSTTLDGVTIDVTVHDATTRAIPYFVSPGEVRAILPSGTPVGDGTIVVNSGFAVGSAPIHVVKSAFGLSTLSPGTGAATAVIHDRAGRQITQQNAAHPGDRLILEGSGLGAISGDETQYQDHVNLAWTSINVEVGSLPAPILYHGRSIYPGLDEIEITIPDGVIGCNVSLVVIAEGIPSNFATVPVTPRGERVCSDSDITTLSSKEYKRLAGRDIVNLGVITIGESETSTSGGTSSRSDAARAAFYRETAREYSSVGFLQKPSLGGCLVMNLSHLDLVNLKSTGTLDAGSQITISGRETLSSLIPLAPPSDFSYVEIDGATSRIVPSVGLIKLENDIGGKDIGPFKVSLAVDNEPSIVWTNKGSITAIDRASDGQVVTWNGGTARDFITISGYSSIHYSSPLAGGSDLYVYFTCTARADAGRFVVPPAVLSSLPPSTTGVLSVGTLAARQFKAAGLDLGLLFLSKETVMVVPFN